MTDVAIVGAGLAGLSLAIRLADKGFAVQIFERAPVMRPVGAGIWLPPNAMVVLDRMGLAATAADVGVEIGEVSLLDADGRVIRTLVYKDLVTHHEYGTISLRRSELHEILVGALPRGILRLDAELSGVEEDSHGVTATFADGRVTRARMVVGADGIRSRVRMWMSPHTQPVLAGGLCARGIAELAPHPDLRTEAREYWGDGVRFGFSPVAGGVYWFAVLVEAPADAAFDHAPLGGLPEPVPTILAAPQAPGVVVAPLEEVPALRPWHKGSVGVIGDAAHASTPNLGQGGAMAIEDAWVLGESIGHHGPVPAALESFERTRRTRVERVARDSRAVGQLGAWRRPVARRLRNAVLRRTPDWVGGRRLRWLFDPALEGATQ